MSPGVYSSTAPALLSGAHDQILRAVAYGGNLDGSVELVIRSARITFDEFTAPRVNAELECSADTLEELAVLAQLDARAGVRVAVEAGYVLADDTEDVHDFVDLGLRKVTASRPANTVQLSLSSDEALVIDASAAVAATVSTPATTSAITALIRQTIAPAPAVIVSAPVGPAVAVNPVTDRWATIADLADRAEIRVYDEGLRIWRIAPPPTAATVPDVTIAGGAGGTLTQSASSIDREPWANYVTLVYRWRDTTDVDREIRATAYATTGPYRVTGPAGKKIKIDRRDVPTTQAEANAAAGALLRRYLTRASAQTIDAVSALWVRPGHTARISDVTGTADRIVSRVEFRHPDRMMTISSRLPDPAVVTATPTTVVTSTPPAAPRTPDPTPEEDTVTTYTSTWKANAFATFRAGGVKRTDSDVDHVVAFGNSGTGVNGNQTGVFLFTAANSTGDETGKTITQALTGVKSIDWIRFRGFAAHFWSYAGGSVRLGYLAAASMPASYASAKPYKTVTDWRRNSWRTSDLTSSAFKAALIAGTSRGVTAGPGASNAQAYYGKLSADGANTPSLTIRYRK